MTIVPAIRCKRCGGNVIYAGEASNCLQCGADYDVDNFRVAMVTDYHSMRLYEFLRKWHISTVTWAKLKKRWGVKGKCPQKGNRISVSDMYDEESKDNHKVPILPAFSNDWPESVMLKWLDIYKDLVVGKSLVDTFSNI